MKNKKIQQLKLIRKIQNAAIDLLIGLEKERINQPIPKYKKGVDYESNEFKEQMEAFQKEKDEYIKNDFDYFLKINDKDIKIEDPFNFDLFDKYTKEREYKLKKEADIKAVLEVLEAIQKATEISKDGIKNNNIKN